MESDTISLTLPIKIPYEVLQQLTDRKLIGMEIGTGKRKQGRILGTSLQASPLPAYDVVLGLKMRIIRKILVVKEVALLIHISLAYDPDRGRLSVGTFKIDSKSKNFLLNKTLEILANRIYYRKVLDKATYNLHELIAPYLIGLNERLVPGLSFSPGLILHGAMENITLTRIEAFADHVLVHALFEGAAEVTVQKIPDTDLRL